MNPHVHHASNMCLTEAISISEPFHKITALFVLCYLYADWVTFHTFVVYDIFSSELSFFIFFYFQVNHQSPKYFGTRSSPKKRRAESV